MELKEKIKQRLKTADDDHVDHILNIVNKYDLDTTVKNFDKYGMVFFDAGDKTVRVCEGNLTDSSIHLKNPHTDIAVIYCDGLLAGWTTSDKLTDLVDRMSIDRKSLNAMPSTFNFLQACAHLSEHGGFYDGENWECAGCGQQLVFKEDE